MIALNCRGMGTSSSVHIIKDLIGAHDPDVICLSETKATGTRMETVRKQLKYQGSHVVPADGRKGGLTVLWKDWNLCFFILQFGMLVTLMKGGGLELMLVATRHMFVCIRMFKFLLRLRLSVLGIEDLEFSFVVQSTGLELMSVCDEPYVCLYKDVQVPVMTEVECSRN